MLQKCYKSHKIVTNVKSGAEKAMDNLVTKKYMKKVVGAFFARPRDPAKISPGAIKALTSWKSCDELKITKSHFYIICARDELELLNVKHLNINLDIFSILC